MKKQKIFSAALIAAIALTFSSCAVPTADDAKELSGIDMGPYFKGTWVQYSIATGDATGKGIRVDGNLGYKNSDSDNTGTLLVSGQSISGGPSGFNFLDTDDKVYDSKTVSYRTVYWKKK